MEAVILSIGNEIITGQTVDTNSAWLSRQVSELGIRVPRHVTVADDLKAIREEIEQAARKTDLVLVTGGLGPTEDDLTRQALAAAMGVDLEIREEYVERIRAFFTARGRQMPESNKVQALFPAGSEPIDNTCGTAPGIKALCGQTTVFVMPGVPREMQEMYRLAVRPFLVRETGGARMLAVTLHTFGAGESDIGELIRDLMDRKRNPTVGTTAKQGVISVRIHSYGRNQEESRLLLEETAAEVRKRLGTLVFGQDEDTLAHAVGRLLIAKQKTLATAESCTGGLIAKLITDVPGSSDYFRQGLVTYANQAKTRLLGVPAGLIQKYGAVSHEVAEALVTEARLQGEVDYAVSVTGVAGPGGGTAQKPVGLVYIGLADATGCEVTRHLFGDHLTRAEIRERTAWTALNRLRLSLCA